METTSFHWPEQGKFLRGSQSHCPLESSQFGNVTPTTLDNIENLRVAAPIADWDEYREPGVTPTLAPGQPGAETLGPIRCVMLS